MRRYGALIAGMTVGMLLALCQVAWAQIAAWPMIAIVFLADMVLGALFGQAVGMVRDMARAGMAPTEWRALAKTEFSADYTQGWAPPPAPLPRPPHYLQPHAFVHAHVYGAADLLALLRARHEAQPVPHAAASFRPTQTAVPAVIQS